MNSLVPSCELGVGLQQVGASCESGICGPSSLEGCSEVVVLELAVKGSVRVGGQHRFRIAWWVLITGARKEQGQAGEG